MPLYIEMSRKVTVSQILFIAVPITSKGFALYGFICITHLKNAFLAMGVGRHYF